MRNLKLAVFLTISIITIVISAGCSNGKSIDETKTKNSVETETKVTTRTFENLDTVDMTGQKVTKEVFKDKKLTIINIWTTWCGACIEEIPALEEIAKEYNNGDVAVKGLPIEIDGQTGKPLVGLTKNEKSIAEDILKKTGATYQQLLVSEDMMQLLKTVEGFPTTYFVNQKGELVGDPILGANTKEDWKKIIEDKLKTLEGK